ncbi:MAG: NCS2 family permease [Phycisphaerales bacterium]|nr:NCS2 family permease [Phycisphaerales bacterium]
MKYFVKRDLDGFFGLFIDNLVQLLLIVGLCGGLCGMSGPDARFIYAHILPGAAVSILLGNLFYAWQARRVARREGRDDVTALPYGINTPSLLVYVFFVMVPAYQRTHDAEFAWKMGLFASLGSGAIEFGGAFVAEWVRRHTPRAALLATLAGIAIGFISMTFALEIWVRPVVAMAALAVVLLALFGRVRFPGGLPGGFVAVLIGTLLAWRLPEAWTGISMGAIVPPSGWQLPHWAGGAVASVFALPRQEWLALLSVIVPMGLFNVVGSLQNIESAEAAGDKFDTRSSLAVNGLGTIAGALFGSCFPTTIYIGHPGWKGLGARAGYSTLNGLVITLICLGGAVATVNSLVPIEAGIAIVVWIGVVITAQAFQATPRAHAPAVALGLFPAIAAWGTTVMAGAFAASGGLTLEQVLRANGGADVNGFLIHGLLLMERGYIFTCMIVAAIAALLIERRLRAAAVWSLVAAGLTFVGLMHAYQLSGNVLDYFMIVQAAPADSAAGPLATRAYTVAAGYLIMAGIYFVADLLGAARGAPAEPAHA